MKRMARWAAYLFAGLVFVACGDDDNPTPTPDASGTDVVTDRATDAPRSDVAPDGVSPDVASDVAAPPDATIDATVDRAPDTSQPPGPDAGPDVRPPDAPPDISADTPADTTTIPDVQGDTTSCPVATCGGRCVDTQVDPQNCGACGTVCTTGNVCARGACQLSCPPGMVACGQSCIDPMSSRTNCGATGTCGQDGGGSAGTACSAGQVCSGGSCQLSCQAGLINCNGTCINPNLNPLHCGATGACGSDGGSSGTVCASGQVCSNGQCQLSCQAGFVNCQGMCINPQTDNAYCGATTGCGAGTGTPGAPCAAGQVCSNGSCQVSCQAGLVNCGGQCVNAANDRTHCGATGDCQGANAGAVCTAGQVCTAGSCQLSCQAGLVNCGGTCVDPQNDRAHCGASGTCQGANAGTACAAGQVCSVGACGLSCQTGLINCDGKCIDPVSDPFYCGASGTCTGPNDGTTCPAGQVCNNGACSLSCQAGLVNCNGFCINPQTDVAYCGASGDCRNANSGTACAAGQVCNAGACTLSCQTGLVNCSGICVNPASDRTHCGASGNCQGANAGTACAAGLVCNAGTCEVSCQSGLVNCGGVCVNPQNSPDHCGAMGDCVGPNAGAVCSPGQVCAGGGCTLSCQQGLLNCNGTCIDPATDNAHCGATTDCQGANAGTACAPGQVCSAGSCTLTCQQGLINCNGVCINPNTDLVNCGASGDCSGANAGTICAAGQICNLGICQLSCQAGLVNCNGVCINPTSDNTYCGASGNCTGGTSGTTCAAGQVCNAGACGLTCQAGLVNCNGTCVNPANDGQHCGASGDCQAGNAGAVCTAGQVCNGGNCALSCQTGLINCGGTCIDPEVDRDHCGALGNCQGGNAGVACSSGQVCNSGICQLSCQSGLINCGGTCINPTTDNGNCGALADCLGPNAGQVCGAGQVCVGGSCQLTCQTGLVNCGSTCIDPLSDRAHCGASGDCSGGNAGVACDPGQVCSGGNCQLSCQAGLVNCGGTCIDPDTNRDHCGASGTCTGGTAGTACVAGQVCSSGACQVSCPVGQVNCSGTCIVPGTDREHCGATGDCQGGNSGTVCADGQVCTTGSCQVSCPGGQINCGGTCVVPATDRNHCGATGDCQGGNSGTACSAGQVCSLGTCQVSCGGGLTNCSGTCSNTSTDPANCNSCGNACPGRTNAAAACAAGNCGFVCNSNFGDCDASRTNGCETNLLTDSNNCGACGTVCGGGSTCSNGVCPCLVVTNDGAVNLSGNNWFDDCVNAVGNNVAVTLKDTNGTVVYEATGPKVGTWTYDQITSTQQWHYDSSTHDRTITLSNGDKLHVSGRSQNISGCWGYFANGYGIFITGSSNTWPDTKMLVMSYLGGANGVARSFTGWSAATEISYNSGTPWSTCGTAATPFSGTFILAVTP